MVCLIMNEKDNFIRIKLYCKANPHYSLSLIRPPDYNGLINKDSTTKHRREKPGESKTGYSSATEQKEKHFNRTVRSVASIMELK